MSDLGLSPKLAALRSDYTQAGLREADVAAEPVAQMERWMTEAIAAGVTEANAATLATVTADGEPRARIVLVKGIDPRGVTFFTNYESAKGAELAANPRAALVLFWKELERQIRIVGDVTKVDVAESAAYFASRPRGSQLGAWASRQSEVVASREALDAQLAALEAKFPGEVPLPPNWGGYRVLPRVVEMWQGRPNRMHDRLRYSTDRGGWRLERLSP
jgi:pyridoxamine 5'-phosphate oxidase